MFLLASDLTLETNQRNLINSGRNNFTKNPEIFRPYIHLNFREETISLVGGAVGSWLMRSTPDGMVWVRVLAGDIVLCCWERHFTLTVPLSTQVYKNENKNSARQFILILNLLL